MKVLKYKKDKGNIYKVLTSNGEYKLYDDIIIKYELLLKKEVTEKEWQKIIKENNLLKAYYESLKYISIKMRTEKEVELFLKKKEYNQNEIEATIKKLQEDKYINHEVYIEAYIHDRLALYIEGEKKIEAELIKLGLTAKEIKPYLNKVDTSVYKDKIKKYIDKKLKVNKKSANEFKRKIVLELFNKGFNREDINNYLETIEITENTTELEKIIKRLYQKNIKKYDINTTKLKIKNNLYQKGYTSIDIDKYLIEYNKN